MTVNTVSRIKCQGCQILYPLFYQLIGFYLIAMDCVSLSRIQSMMNRSVVLYMFLYMFLLSVLPSSYYRYILRLGLNVILEYRKDY